jgi:hypothetical protein
MTSHVRVTLDALLMLPAGERATMLEALLKGRTVESAVVVPITVARRSVRSGHRDVVS